MMDLPDNQIYMSKAELAANTGRKPEDISDEEYERYLNWMGSRWD